MNEKIYTTKKNGMVVLLAELLVYALAITGIVLFAISYENYPRTGTLVMMVLCIVVTAIAWIPLCGLRILKPQEALVLTTGCPKVPSGGLVYYKYHLRMPNGFDLLKPKDFDEEYFCSALYTLASQYELGSIVPLLCRNYSSSQTVKSLCAYLNRFA